jgi:glycosyltransferase involved in cell wall biosynthesis
VLVDRYDPAMAALIEDTLRSQRFDLVIASQWYMADYYRPAWGLPAIFEEVELGLFQDMRRQAANPLKRLRHSLTNLKLSAFLSGFLPNFCACTVVSPGERSLLEQTTGYNRVEVLPNGVDVASYQGEFAAPAEAHGFPYLVYTGSFRYPPNYDAMRWFTGEVLPLVLARTPELRLLITGDHAGLPLPEIEAPDGGGRAVRLTGFVPDVRPYVAAAAASLAPLRSGGGTRLKILEAMALRTPVIATSKGAEGLAVVPGKHLLVADTPQDYAAAVVRLLAEPALAAELADNAYALVRERYDWQALMPSFLAMVERCAAFPAN